jgi:hypothetical protein
VNRRDWFLEPESGGFGLPELGELEVTASLDFARVGCMAVNESLTQLLLAHFEHNAPHDRGAST